MLDFFCLSSSAVRWVEEVWGHELTSYHQEVRKLAQNGSSWQGRVKNNRKGVQNFGWEYCTLSFFWMGDYLSHQQQQHVWDGAVDYSLLLLEYLTVSTVCTRRGSCFEEVLCMCLVLISLRTAGLLSVFSGEFVGGGKGNWDTVRALQVSSLPANQQQKNLVTSIWLLCFLPLTSLVPQEPSVWRNQAFLQDLNDKPKLILKECGS